MKTTTVLLVGGAAAAYFAFFTTAGKKMLGIKPAMPLVPGVLPTGAIGGSWQWNATTWQWVWYPVYPTRVVAQGGGGGSASS